MEKIRLDVLLTEKGFFDSREKARRVIMAGSVYVNNQKYDKPGTKVDIDSKIDIRGNVFPYVSRGGLKLEKAIKEFNIILKDLICIDIGASTGGFTDCMLQNYAKKVYTIDVGYGQLDWKLRQDPRVVTMERTNIRYVKPEDLVDLADFVSIDVSFISLKLVLPVVKNLINDSAEIVALIKPQFEAGRENVGKKGVVKDINIHKEVVSEIVEFAKEMNFHISNFSFSPIKGPEGNIEYLIHLKNIRDKQDISIEKIYNNIEQSHIELNTNSN
ncbi:MAG: TlyA family RNA methyltransferase [Clostridiales bacterium]|nr:TlyA family RNA methyltransferase [Clostridiales bacterium]